MSASHQQLPVKDIGKALVPFLKPHMSLLVYSVVLMGIASVSSVLIPTEGKGLIDYSSQLPSSASLQQQQGDLCSDMNGSDKISQCTQIRVQRDLLWLGGRLCALVAIYHLVSLAGHVFALKVGVRTSTSMIRKITEAISTIPWEDTIQVNPAEYSQILMQSARFAGDTVSHALTELFPSIVAVIGFFIMVLYISPVLTLLLCGVVLGMQLFQRWRANHFEMTSNQVSLDEARVLAVVTNIIQRSAMVRIFHCTDYILKILDERSAISITSTDNLNYSIHSNAAFSSAITNMLFVVLIVSMSYLRTQEMIGMTDITLFFFYVSQLINRAVSIGDAVNKVVTMMQKTVPFVLLLRKEYTITAMKELKGVDFKISTKIDNPAIVLSNVTFTYNSIEQYSSGVSVNGVSIVVKKGHFVGIIGHSGSGKTTLLRLMSGLIKPTKGTVSIMDEISMLEQASSLFVGTIADNIRIGRPSATFHELKMAAEKGGCLKFIMDLPRNFDTPIENIDTSSFSEGQIQRICLARVFLSHHNIVIFDEPTTGLDPRASSAFFESAMRLREEGRTLVVVTHDHTLVKGADEVFVVRGGQIVANGRLEEIPHDILH
eukprot:Tbor_TRINITY_DN1968_c0_g1::TRINITY_DN1968_c0_g1_i1::g.3575::m.3575/K06147/ABCB-BAC; ATP-binding cassette, subfamily B, bacterial